MSSPGPDPDPASAPRGRPLLGVRFWALIALGVLGPLAGVGVVYLAPRLAPAKPEPPPVRAEGPPATNLIGAPALPARPPTPAEPAARADVARLNARIAALETAGARSSEAATAALAAAAVVEASQGSRPFANELSALRAAAPTLAELASLDRLARDGAPSRVALATSFPEFAARAARRAHKPSQGAPLSERIAYGAARFVTVRRLDAASGPDAEIAAAERALEDGDIVRALDHLDRLPPPAREALSPWRIGAERRAEIDRAVAALRVHALQAVAAERPPA